MIKRLIAATAVLLTAVVLAGDGGLNPQFVKWRKMKAAGFLPEQRAAAQKADTISLTPGRGGSMVGDDLTGQVVGLAPDVAALGYLSDMVVGSHGFAPVDGYPRSYDLRNEARVTGVRDQGKFDTCWAFGTFASLESSILVQKPANQSYTAADIDFSERHMVDNHGYDLTAKNGGSMLMAMAYLLRWGGPASETSVPYPAAGTTTWPTETLVGDGPRLHVQNVRWLPGKTAYLDNDEIKKNVMEKGGVYVTYYMDTNYFYKASTAAYYCPYLRDCNHGVTIVGWNDDYPGENFQYKLFGLLRPADGAYLVKNSWGETFGQNGYFWVSYYDRNFAVSPMAVFCGNESKYNYSTIYQYDELGYTGKSHAGNNKQPNAWMANVFTPEADDKIAAVGFYALVPNISYSIRVYTGCQDDATTDKKGPASGKLWRTQNGKLDYAGYVTVPLKSPVNVKAGEKFAVCVQIAFAEKTFDSYGNVVNPLPYEVPVEGYSSRASAAANQSYYSKNGSEWYDLANSVRGANFCLKAYGVQETPDPALKEMSATGPNVILAGNVGIFTGTCVYDDGSTWEEFDVEYEVVSDEDNVIQGIERENNKIKVSIKPNLAAESRIVLRLYYEDDITVSKEFAVAISRGTPPVPTGLRATDGEDAVESGVRLAWDAVTNATSYAIYRSEGDDSRNATYLATVSGTKYTDLSATPGTDYTYFLKAQNTAGNSDFSAGVKGWRRLSAPATFTASDGDYDYVQLEWTAVEGARYYRVIRDTDMDAEGNPTENAVILTNTVDGIAWTDKLAYQDTPPSKGSNYIYWVQSSLSFTGYRPSAWSIFDLGFRAAPVALSAVQIQGEANVKAGTTARYTLVATLTNGSRIENVTNATWSCSLANGQVTGADYTLTALVNEELVASNTLVSVSATWTHTTEDGSVTKSDTKYVVIAPVVPKKPNAPKVRETTTAGVAVEWNPVEGASSYRLYRGETAETAELLFSTPELSYLDVKIIPGATCRYWIEAVNAAGTSEKSDASADARRQFNPPIYVTASNGTSTEDVQVSWRAVTGAKRYRVSRTDSATGTPHALSDWISERTFSDTTATPGETYWYFVQAAYDENGGSASDYSAATIGKVSPAQTLEFIEITGPSSIQYDSQGSYYCTARYANGVEKRVNPTWSFKSANPLVTVGADGIVTAGHVTGDDLHLELQASYTDNGITKTDSFAIAIVAFVEEAPTVFVSNVVVRARWPWNGLVDISYDLYSSPATARAVVTVSGFDHDLNRTLQAVTLSGDGITSPAAGGAPHKDCRVTWNIGADYENFHASAFSVALGAAPFMVASPANFRASDNTSTNGVELAWEAAFGAEGYEIFRSTTNERGDAEKISFVEAEDARGPNYTDDTAEPGETYYYWIRTVAGEFESDISPFSDPVTGKRAIPRDLAGLNLREGLIAYYPFDGDTSDQSGNGHHLTIGTASLIPTEGYEGSTDKAYYFNGRTALGPAEEFVVYSNFTFACWFRTTVTTPLANEHISGIDYMGFNTLLGAAQTQKLGSWVGLGVAVGVNGVNVFEHNCCYRPAVLRYDTTFTDGWHQLAFVVNNNGAPILYLDGQFVREGLQTGHPKCIYLGTDWNGNRALLGGSQNCWGDYSGDMDEVCIYGTALTADKIAALYKTGKPGDYLMQVALKPTAEIVYSNSIAHVTLSSGQEENAVIRYTISRNDGGDTVDSREYTTPFAIDGNATLTIWNEREGYYNSPEVVYAVNSGWRQTAHDALAPDDEDGKIEFATSGDSDWVFDPNQTSDNVEGSMRSGAIVGGGISTMTATVTGAGQFAFDWKVSSEYDFDYLQVIADGETTHKISGEVDWTELVLELTNDTAHVITWNYTKDASVNRGSDCGWVDHVTWAPLGSAVDRPYATVTPMGEGAENGASNEVALACANVTGATIEYRVDLFGEEGEWQAYEGPFVIEGEATVYARAKKSGYIDSFTSKTDVRRPWLIRVGEALLMDPVTKAAVTLEADYYEYGIDEEFWWDQDRTVVSDGTCASVKSPTLGDGPAGDPAGIGASIFGRVSGPGTLYFDWKVDSEAGWDVLTYYAGEYEQDYAYAEAISGDKDWDRIKLVFTADAEHVVEWEYNKDDRGKAGRDCGWVDYLKWVPARYAPATPEPRIGYVFGGWTTNENGAVVYDAGEQMDAEDLNETFLPVWSPITYMLVYDAETAADGSKEQTFTYDVAQNLYAASNFAFKRGYAFAGWTTNENGTVDFADGASVMNLATEQHAVVTLKPVEDPITYTVKFYDKNLEPTGDADIAATYDQDFTFPTPTPQDGWRFDGWSASPTNDLVVYAAGQKAKNLGCTQDEVVCFYAIWTQLADPFSIAVDLPGVKFDVEGDAAWFVQDKVTKEGETALQSGKITGGQSSTLTATYVAASKTKFTFWWKVSSEPTWDTLKFMVNDKVITSISGLGADWQQYSMILMTGTNTLKWVYAKDGTGDRGDDCGWLDHLSIEKIQIKTENGDVFVAENGSDTTGDGSEANPFRTIQMGVDCVDENRTVHVKPGMYPSFRSYNRSITIESTEGAASTIIDGSLWKEPGVTNCCAHLSDFPVTRGASASYCRTKLIGFTLQHGANGASGGSVYNCIIQDCYSGDDGGGACGTTLYNCVLTRNYAADGAGCTSGGACRSCTLYNCTVYDNRSRSNGAGITYCVAYNCIIWHNFEDNGRETNVNGGWSSQIYNCITDEDPLFTDAANGDFTLRQGSPAIDAGNSGVVTYATDFAGNGRIGGSAVDCGAFEFDPSTIVPIEEPVFKVIQYCINKQPYTVDDAVAATNTPSIWKHDPVTETYTQICFRDNAGSTRQNFQSSAVKWPATIQDGYKSDYFACQITGTVNVPTAGEWTFAVGSDDGYRMILTDEDGKTYSMEYYRDRSFANDMKTFNLTKTGRYKVYIIYFEYVETSILEVSCAKGKKSRFTSSDFKLMGTPESGITLVGGNN